MKFIRWNLDKNEWLKANRGVCFEQVALILQSDEALDILEHPNQKKYPGQKLAVVMMNEYVHLVPFVEADDEQFLKTIIPSRKATAQYLR